MTLFLPAPTYRPLRVYSDGAGTQSIAVMVLQAQGRLAQPYDAFVFANVGEDSENPDTLTYRREIMLPFAAQHGLNVIERQKMRKGKPDTVYQATVRDNRSIPIPIVFPGQGYGNRSCTIDFKVEVVNKYARATKSSHVVMGIGFSSDEGARIIKKPRGWHDRNWTYSSKKRQWIASKKTFGFWKLYEFPLADMQLRRQDCESIIREAGLPKAPSSLCKFCPFTRRETWIERKRTGSPIYTEAIEMEKVINAKYQKIRSGHPKASPFVALHPDGIPLEQVGDQLSMWDIWSDEDESCVVGYCGV